MRILVLSATVQQQVHLGRLSHREMYAGAHFPVLFHKIKHKSPQLSSCWVDHWAPRSGIIDILTTPLVLLCPDFSQPCPHHTDAFDHGLGSVLYQPSIRTFWHSNGQCVKNGNNSLIFVISTSHHCSDKALLDHFVFAVGTMLFLGEAQWMEGTVDGTGWDC